MIILYIVKLSCCCLSTAPPLTRSFKDYTMAMYLCGGASRIVLRMNVEQEITLEGQNFIKQQLEELQMTDGELIHWASMDDCYDLASLLISFGYKGPEHKEDADFILHGVNYDNFYPEWLQIIDVHIKEKGRIVDFKQAYDYSKTTTNKYLNYFHNL